MSPLLRDPSTPLNRPRPSGSPLASSLPFDWDAVKNRRPPPYGTPGSQRRLRKRSSIGVGGTPGGSGVDSPSLKGGARATPKRVYRKVSVQERIANWMSQMFYDIQDFPRQRMPEPRTIARVLGACLHFTHLVVRYAKLQQVKDEDIGWEDMLGEMNMPGVPSVSSWFNWTTPVAILLITASVLNAVYLFTRIKFYHLFNRPDPVSSPSAEMVDSEDSEPPPLTTRILTLSIHIFWVTWSFLLGTQPPTPRVRPSRKVQRLSVWAPEEGEMTLFIIYSPLHALLWQAVSPGNWIMIFLLLAMTSGQLYVIRERYTILLKDKEILASEVMHEYDEKFVYPHIMRVRRDVGVMTNEAETIYFR